MSGELCLSPVGLSVTTKLAPDAFSAQTMSLWLLSDACAQGINAKLTPLFSANTEISYFGYVGGASVLLGLVIFFISPMIHRHMRGLN
ncbi:hypothetical protein GCM10011391_10410 [Pullulanibacillus camelliae]|uniref:Major facilitator superfamily (MFS) profile domain-containing protein n=1 Tax=Pullulanibacillus camelliae TaxID=1707096 RepID=A0A8J2VN12_9BACL|nr:hypothetical protein GCM10011391_10410 [Pullulanibacillus camelliae]